jgi:hypothetical protein
MIYWGRFSGGFVLGSNLYWKRTPPMRSRPRIWLILFAILIVPLGLFLILLGGFMCYDAFFSDTYAISALIVGAPLYAGIGTLFLFIVLSSKTLRIDLPSLTATITPLVGAKTQWSREQIEGYSTGSRFTKIGRTQTVTLHFAEGETFTLTALATSNFRQLRELIATHYPRFTFHPIRAKARKLSRSQEIRQRLRVRSPR